MTYEEYRAAAIQRAQAPGDGSMRSTYPWPPRYVPVDLARRLGSLDGEPDQWGMVKVADTFRLQDYFSAKERYQNRVKFQ